MTIKLRSQVHNMLTKCANPSCSASFRFLHSGKLFHFDSPPRPSVEGQLLRKPANSGEMFWLCEECAAEHTLVIDIKCGVQVVPLGRVPHEQPHGLPPHGAAIAV